MRKRKLEEITRGIIKWDKLPALATDGHEFVTKTLGMARRKKSHRETRQCDTANDVSDKFGHQNCIQ